MAHGGKDLLATGKPDSGKTGLLIAITRRLVARELCIWRGLKTGQAFRFPGHLNAIAYQCRPRFFDAYGNSLKLKLKVVNSFEDVLGECELGKLNALYMPFQDERQHWVDFGEFLVQRFPSRYASNFISLFMDEAEDLIPAPEEGTTREVRKYLEQLKEYRKVLVSAYFATQQFFDLHWRALGKIRYRVYLKGAYVPKREKRVMQEAVDNLPLGRGIIAGSYFGFFTFGNYPTKDYVVVR